MFMAANAGFDLGEVADDDPDEAVRFYNARGGPI